MAKEFSCHEAMAEALGCEHIFPNLNVHGSGDRMRTPMAWLRQYFPKAMELVDGTLKQVFAAVAKLNCRSRKCLGVKTPYEVFIAYYKNFMF
jgi:IS30 family transposase